jgi:hypothetical protein
MTLKILVDFSAAIGVGFATFFFVQDKAISFLVGLITFFCVEMFFLSYWANSAQSRLKFLEQYFGALAPADKFSEVVLLTALRSYATFKESTLLVDKEHIYELWRDCVSRAGTSFSSVSYASPKDTWFLSWGREAALAIQRERIESGCKIERVFIVDTSEELAQLQSTFSQQRAIGIKVFWLLNSNLRELERLETLQQQLGTCDIALVDNEWVYRTHLDKRQPIRASACRSRGITEAASAFLLELKGMARNKGQVVA